MTALFKVMLPNYMCFDNFGLNIMCPVFKNEKGIKSASFIPAFVNCFSGYVKKNNKRCSLFFFLVTMSKAIFIVVVIL